MSSRDREPIWSERQADIVRDMQCEHLPEPPCPLTRRIGYLRNGLNDSIETSHNLHQRALNAYNWMLNHTADHECKADVWHWRKERMVCDICWRREDWRKDLQDLAAIMNNITRLEAVRKEHG